MWISCVLSTFCICALRNVFIPMLFSSSVSSLCLFCHPSVCRHPLSSFPPATFTSISLYFFPYYPSFPSTTPLHSVPSALRLVSVLLVLSNSLSYSWDWNYHRQLVLMYFAPKARGDEEKCAWDSWCSETVGVSECPSYQMPTCSFNFPFPPFCLLFGDLHHHYCSFVWLLQGEWGIQLEWGILSIVFVSLRIIIALD